MSDKVAYWLCAASIIAIASPFLVRTFQNIKKVYTFFDAAYIVENFRSIRDLNRPYLTAKHGKVAEFTTNTRPLPVSFTCKNKKYNLHDWLPMHWVTGLVVLKINDITDATLLHESYHLGNTKDTKTISWSINKSVVSALIGVAVGEGKIASIDDDVTLYAPTLKGSGYDGVKIVDVLQMSSGVKFDENYDSLCSDINVMSYKLALGYDMESYIKTLKRVNEPGTKHSYISSDTQVLGMVLNGATGQSLTSYLEEKIWQRGGFESDCDWLVDSSGKELAFGTQNTSTRDYARFGWLNLNKGKSPLDGKQLIDEQWVTNSVKGDKAHLKPSYPDKFGYGYQWWLPGTADNANEPKGDYLAIGVYNQFIYVDPVSKIVIALNSANPNYNKQTDANGSNSGEVEAVELFRAIASHYN